MSQSEQNELIAGNHYMTACYYKSNHYFADLPDCQKLDEYYHFLKKIKKEVHPIYRNRINATLYDHIDYAESEKKFRELLTEEQLTQFKELREKIIVWYHIQKKVFQYNIEANGGFESEKYEFSELPFSNIEQHRKQWLKKDKIMP